MSVIRLKIRSPSQEFNNLSVTADLEWKIENLKRHISEIHNNGSIINSQRIIYNGRLLRDDETLQNIFPFGLEENIIHIVFSLKSSQPRREELEDDKIELLKREYAEYLRDFYTKHPMQYYNQMNFNHVLSSMTSQAIDSNSQSGLSQPNPPQPQQQPLLRRILPNFLFQNVENENEVVDQFDVITGIIRLFMIIVAISSYFSFSKLLVIIGFVCIVYLASFYNQNRRVNQVINVLHQVNVADPNNNNNEINAINNNINNANSSSGESSEAETENQENVERQEISLTNRLSIIIEGVLQTIWSFLITVIPENIPLEGQA